MGAWAKINTQVRRNIINLQYVGLSLMKVTLEGLNIITGPVLLLTLTLTTFSISELSSKSDEAGIAPIKYQSIT